MNRNVNITAQCTSVYWTNSQTSLVLLSFVHQYLVDHNWHASYHCCGKVLSTCIKVPSIPLKKVNLLYINYCTNYIHSLLQHLHS